MRDLLVMKQFSLLEIVAVFLLLMLLLLVVDLEVETSRMPLLWTHTSSNSWSKWEFGEVGDAQDGINARHGGPLFLLCACPLCVKKTVGDRQGWLHLPVSYTKTAG